MTSLYPQTPRTSPTRESERVSYERETVHAVLDEALVCHVGFVVDGRPVVLPHLHARLGEVLYLHGSTGARAMRAAQGNGLEVCGVRTGPPVDDPEDLGLPYWAGVLPLVTNAGTPQPSKDLADGVAVPGHITAWKRPTAP